MHCLSLQIYRSTSVYKLFAGPKWRAHRKLIAPTFHLNVLKSFIDLFNANSRAVVEKLRKEGDNEFDIHDYMSECTVEILLETAMGVSKSTQDQSGFEYAMAVMKQVSKKKKKFDKKKKRDEEERKNIENYLYMQYISSF